MIDRRQFLQLIGAAGATFLLPREGEASGIDRIANEDPNSVNFTINFGEHGEKTRWMVMTQDGDVILADGVTHEDHVTVPIPKTDQWVRVHAISEGHQFSTFETFVKANEHAEHHAHMIMVKDRNYLPCEQT